MEDLPVIPTPKGQRWREFRITVFPAIVVVCTLVVIVFLWREHVSPPTLIAEAEPIRAYVISPDAGMITNLLVTRFQPVKRGDIIARVISSDNRRLDMQVQLLRSQISLSQLQLGALIDRDRLAFDYHDLRSEYLRQQVELATAQAELEPARRDYELALQLQGTNIFGVYSQQEVDFFARAYFPLKAKVEQTTTFVQELETKLEQTRSLGEFVASAVQNSSFGQAMADLDKQRQMLEALQAEPLALEAPMDGIVTTIHRQEGENIVAGEPLVTISATYSERLVGYLRQPLPFQPEEGMKVVVRTRSAKRQIAESHIAAVGAQFEVITNVALMRPNAMLEVGLPLAINMPQALQAFVRPGEPLEVTIRRK
jgi:multidrug resistance efflux pump